MKETLFQKINDNIQIEAYKEDQEVWLLQGLSAGDDIVCIDADALNQLISLLNKAKKELE